MMSKSATFRDRIVRWFVENIQRPTLAFFYMPGARGFGVLLAIFAAVIVIAVIDLDQNYIHPESGTGLDAIGALYVVFSLLVFETALPLPASAVTRIVFFRRADHRNFGFGAGDHSDGPVAIKYQ